MTASSASALRAILRAPLTAAELRDLPKSTQRSGIPKRKVNQYDKDTPSRRDEIYEVLAKYARTHSCAIPIQRRAWTFCYAMGIQIAETTFDKHWRTLKNEGRISVDEHTGTPYIPGLAPKFE